MMICVWRNIIAVCFLTCLVSCTSVPVSSMWKLRSVNPLQVEAKYLSIAVRYPTALDLTNSHTVMTLAYFPPEGPATIEEHFEFEQSHNARIPTEILTELKSDEAASILWLPAKEFERFATTQQKIKQAKQAEEGKGSFSINVNGFCLRENVNKNMQGNIYLKLERDGEYIHLIKNMSLLQEGFDWGQVQCK